MGDLDLHGLQFWYCFACPGATQAAVSGPGGAPAVARAMLSWVEHTFVIGLRVTRLPQQEEIALPQGVRQDSTGRELYGNDRYFTPQICKATQYTGEDDLVLMANVCVGIQLPAYKRAVGLDHRCRQLL